jgi:Rrf2 family protein
MLTLTRKTEYGMIAVCHLARSGQQVVSAREIAAEHHVPLPLLMNVLKRLNRTGYVRSVRGAHGGYVLAVPAEQFTLTDLIEAVEGPVHLVRCVNPSKGARKCDLPGACFIQHSVVKVHNRLRKFLGAVTIADLATAEQRPNAADGPKVVAR